MDKELIPEEEVTLYELVAAIRRKCFHCQRAPRLLKRPKDMTFLAEEPNEILHSDYVYLNQYGYLLTLLDNFSGKVLLKHAQSPTAEVVAEAISEWRGHFSIKPHFLLVTGRVHTSRMNCWATGRGIQVSAAVYHRICAMDEWYCRTDQPAYSAYNQEFN